MKASEKALDLIKCFESFRAKPYRCFGGVLTVGYGHTRLAKHYPKVTHAHALSLLAADVEEAEWALSKHVRATLNQNQYDALVSFIFNVGAGKFSKSTLLKKLNSHDYKTAAAEFLRWKYSGGIFLRGLKFRREAERELFLTPVIARE